MTLQFDNRFLAALPGDPSQAVGIRQVRGALWSQVLPTAVAAPRTLAVNVPLALQLGLEEDFLQSPAFAEVFGGNALLQGMQPWASNYGGHQFGHWAGQLGDGRAISLGEVVDVHGQHQELQLKGAGPTPYSRHADGRAVLRSSIREFLCSEAMHHLGVPTTRALSLVATGDAVVRDMFYDGHPKAEQGAIVCRVAPSFLRFGHFELPASRDDIPLLRSLLDFTLRTQAPDLAGQGAQGDAEWFGRVCERTALMVAHWMRVGFVHGVMNTDNMSVLGLTIDYGPYGWIDDYDPDWTPNTTDAQGRRYRYGWQPRIAYWNLSRLAMALSPLFESAEPLQAGLERYQLAYAQAEQSLSAGKLGLSQCDARDMELMTELQVLMQSSQADMTRLFRRLGDLPLQTLDANALEGQPTVDAFYAPLDEAARQQWNDWLARYRQRCQADALSPEARQARMRAHNPRYVLRNYLAQQAIDRAEAGDLGGVHRLREVLQRPYEDQPGAEAFDALRPDWAREKAGCSMLSCSS